ncbi:hypothetical protein [Halobacteriovorax sp. DPLXC-1]|uniref:hypothetical protein n=1 Tax=Halobacteriovorax sp. DPLXC-1 TaxID=3110771 RepID=UPI002FF42705
MKFLISLLFLFTASAQTQVFYGVDSARPGDKECRIEVLKFKDDKISVRITGGYDKVRTKIRDIKVYKIADKPWNYYIKHNFRGDFQKRVDYIDSGYVSFFFLNGYSKSFNIYIDEFEPENEYIKIQSFNYSQIGTFHKKQSIRCDID